MTAADVAKIGLLYLVATMAGSLAARLGLPLPWMIGPLLSTTALCLGGLVNVEVPTATRPFGQVVVAIFVGAHFTPEAFQSLLSNWPVLLGASVYTILVSVLIARIQSRLFGTEAMSSFLSIVPTSPVEASILAEANDIPGAPVALAQTIRIVLVVTTIPILLNLLGDVAPKPVPVPGARDMLALAMTVAGGLAGFCLFRILRLSNPFFLGPLLIAALLSGSGHPVFEFPQPVLSLAQIILGTWLGASFRRDVLIGRSALLASILFSSTLLLVFCLLGAWLLSLVTQLPTGTLVLGFAPGGVTEMALTAGLLGQDVALVTAMHLARIFVIMPNLTWIIRFARSIQARRR